MPRLASVTARQLAGQAGGGVTLVHTLNNPLPTNPDPIRYPNNFDYFGYAVAIDGNNAIVTAKEEFGDPDPTTGTQQNDEGKAYICLLYTSPSPRDRTRSRMPSSA